MRVNAFQAKESRGNLVANTDQLALLGIAKTLLSRRARPSGEASPELPVYADLRELTRCRRSQIREQTATANRIHTIVDQLCPGFLDASKSGLTPFCAASLELMKDRFSAPELARRKPPALAKLLRRHHGAEAWNPSSVSTRGVPPPVPSRPLSPARPARPRRPRISRPAKKPQRPGPADHAQKPASKKVKNIICIDLILLTPNTDRNHRRCCIVKRSMTFPGLPPVANRNTRELVRLIRRCARPANFPFFKQHSVQTWSPAAGLRLTGFENHRTRVSHRQGKRPHLPSP